MPDNTNVNNNASVVVVGRTAPVPPGQQKSEKSVPVVIASDQSTIPVAEQNKVASEVALSLLGIPRSEVALGIFADVNTYDVNPTEWAAEPEVFTESSATGYYSGIGANMGHGLTHIPAEAGALLEAPIDKTAVLTSKRFFRYQPGRVSAATFGVKTTVMNPSTTDTSAAVDTEDIGSTIFNPAIRKYGIFDNFDGYYWETRNNGQGDNFCVVRRTQSLLFNNPVKFDINGQTADFGATNPEDVLAPRGNESPDDKAGKAAGFGGTSYPSGHDSTPVGFENVGLGSMVIYRDNLMMTHAAMYDPSLLQDEVTVGITSSLNGALTFASNTGMGISISNAVYDIDTGLMTVTCHDAHNYSVGKYVHLSGIGMTCEFSFIDASGNKQSTIQGNGLKKYPDRTFGYNILQVGTTTSFVVNVGVSTVPTFYHSGGVVLGLSTSQYVSYSKGSNTNPISGLVDGRIYKVNSIEYAYSTGITTVSLKQISEPITSNYRPAFTDHSKAVAITNSTEAGHSLTTPVPFVRPVANGILPEVSGSGNIYSSTKRSGMFPYLYRDKDGNNPEGYIDTTLATSATATLEAQISVVNDFYKHWINQNVKKDFWNVYEYRVPRSRFSGDRLDNLTDNLLYSDVTANNRAGSNVIDTATNTIQTDTSIWNLEFDKVTMYKIEFSWYGAVGALFLAYVPVGAGEARWVRVHHLRASNQLKGSSLGNATLPITYMVYGGGSGNGNSNALTNTKFGYSTDTHNETASRIGGFGYGSASQHIVKYGASYYIDGGDRGTVKLFSHGTPTGVEVFGSKRVVNVGTAATQVNFSNSTATEPYIIAGGSSGISGTSFYVGSKVITGNDLDQNIEITYVNGNNLFLNSPLATVPSGTVTIIANRPTPLVGLKCRDFITSSLGQDVRNRTQVYPTRLSTGSTAMIKIDLLKSPIFQTTSTINGSLSLNETVDKDIGKRGKSFLVTVSNNSYLSEDTGVYGYFRAKFKNDPANKIVTIFGYLERRSATTGTAGYYFRAEDSTSDDIELIKNSTFLYEQQSNPKGEGTTSVVNEFTLDSLSSIKISPQVRAPIPKTGTIVASLFIPASGEDFDLSSYFDYNKEYLSFPLTNVVESLFVVGSSEGLYNSGAPIATTNASITWEEQ